MRISDKVHYVSYGTPLRADNSQAYTAQCRAAVVTEVGQNDVPLISTKALDPDIPDTAEVVGLFVMNPSGVFFANIPHDDGSYVMGGGVWHGGTWHTLDECPDTPRTDKS